MDVQKLESYEATFQFALGDLLRDLAILMRYAEQGQLCDETNYARTQRHLQTFREHLDALEDDLRSGRELGSNNDTRQTSQ